MIGSFLDYAEKRQHYSDCLSDLDNFLERHSDSIKFNRLNNIKGVHKIISELQQNLDKFIEVGEDIEITIPK